MKPHYILKICIFLFCLFVHGQKEDKTLRKNTIDNLNKSVKYFNSFNVEKSLKHARIALDGAYKLKDHSLTAKSYNIIAVNFDEFGEVSKSIVYFKKFLEYAELAKNDTLMDWANNNLGNVYYHKIKDYKTSVSYYLKGLSYSNKINDRFEALFSELNLCAAYFKLKEFDKGLQCIKNTQTTVKETRDIQPKVAYNTLYGIYYSYKGNAVLAESYFKEAEKICLANDIEIIRADLAELYLTMYEHFERNNKFEKALIYFKKNIELLEQLHNKERKQSFAKAANQIEFKELEKQINVIESEKNKQSKDLKNSRIITLLFALILLFLILLLYSQYKNIRYREQKNKELSQANQELKEAKEKAEIASNLKTQFVSTISHELRTPLYGVVGITDILIDEHKELAQNQHLNALKFSAKYLLSLVNDLLQMNKIEENKVELEKVPFHLQYELNEIVESLQFIAIRNSNKLHYEIDTQIPKMLVGDKLRLSQIFINLVSNALKFTKNGTVFVKATLLEKTEETCKIKFYVIDTGAGISKENQHKIFDKFVQLDRKSGDYQGTGLGLSIVKKLLELFNSKIELESELNQGTTFHFDISFEIDKNFQNNPTNIDEMPVKINSNYKILVVEDNKINRIVTKKILDSGNIESVIVEDGYVALDILDYENFDAILMDINMPLIDGYETTKMIRKKGIKTPVIALTAYDRSEILEKVNLSGMNEVLMKPFEVQNLYRILNKYNTQQN